MTRSGATGNSIESNSCSLEEGGIYITPDKIPVEEEVEEGDEVEEVEEGIVEDDGIKYETHMVAL